MVSLNMCESVLDRSLMWMFRSPSITILLYFVILFARSSVISSDKYCIGDVVAWWWMIYSHDVQWPISKYSFPY